MSYEDRILDLLWSIAPDGATNDVIRERLGLGSHQVVYMTTQKLVRQGRVRGERSGKTWVFFGVEERTTAPLAVPPRSLTDGGTLTALEFERLARYVFETRYGVALPAGTVPGVRKSSTSSPPTTQSWAMRSTTRAFVGSDSHRQSSR